MKDRNKRERKKDFSEETDRRMREIKTHMDRDGVEGWEKETDKGGN